MADRPTSHPSAQKLQAFGLGKLTDVEARSVARHLKECAACARAVQQVRRRSASCEPEEGDEPSVVKSGPRKRKRPAGRDEAGVPVGLVLGAIGGGAVLVLGVVAVGVFLWLRGAAGPEEAARPPDVAVAPSGQREAASLPAPAATSRQAAEPPAPAPKEASPPPAPPPRESKTELLVQGLRNGDALFLDGEEVPGPAAGPDGKKPLEVKGGTHQLRLTRTGHREWTWEGSVAAGQTVPVTAAPEKLRGAAPLDGAPIGKAAPEIEWDDLDGKAFKLSDYRGKVVLLDFWGNW